MKIDFSKLTSLEAYRWLASTITPRPIAWVATRSSQGIDNLAPFSFFQVISDDPATVMITVNHRDDGSFKDTLNNLKACPDVCISLVRHAHAEAMNASSETLAAGVSEFEHCQIPAVAADTVAALRVVGAPVAFEGRAVQLMPYPADKPNCHLVFVQVLAAHVDDTVLTGEGRVDPAKLDLIGRLGGSDYSTTRDRFAMQRPRQTL